MKFIRSRRSAFTLIELLVVISIIAVLASLTFAGVQTALVAAKKVTAKNDMAQIANAIQFYYTEYSKYPIESTVTTDSAAHYSDNNDAIIGILRYATSSNCSQDNLDTYNPRQIKFIQPKVADLSATALTKAAVNKNSGKWFDPWGKEYILFIDADYGGDIDPSAVFSGMAKQSVSVGVASWGFTYTKDKTAQIPHAYTSKTDLISW